MDWVKIVARKDGLGGETYQWNRWCEALEGKEFIAREEDVIRCEEVYLESIVQGIESPGLALFRNVRDGFTAEPEALLYLGNRAFVIGDISLDKASYEKIAISAYEAALRIRTPERFPMDYAMTQNNLGTAYSTLAEVEDKAENCKKAISAYEAALKTYTPGRFPMDYAMTQNNLGNAYRTLAEVEDKAENCKKAISAYEAALRIFTTERFPEVYPLINGNLRRALDFCRGEKA